MCTDLPGTKYHFSQIVMGPLRSSPSSWLWRREGYDKGMTRRRVPHWCDKTSRSTRATDSSGIFQSPLKTKTVSIYAIPRHPGPRHTPSQVGLLCSCVTIAVVVINSLYVISIAEVAPYSTAARKSYRWKEYAVRKTGQSEGTFKRDPGTTAPISTSYSYIWWQGGNSCQVRYVVRYSALRTAIINVFAQLLRVHVGTWGSVTTRPSVTVFLSLELFGKWSARKGSCTCVQ